MEPNPIPLPRPPLTPVPPVSYFTPLPPSSAQELKQVPDLCHSLVLWDDLDLAYRTPKRKFICVYNKTALEGLKLGMKLKY